MIFLSLSVNNTIILLSGFLRQLVTLSRAALLTADPSKNLIKCGFPLTTGPSVNRLPNWLRKLSLRYLGHQAPPSAGPA
jgi:hypothetical protein